MSREIGALSLERLLGLASPPQLLLQPRDPPRGLLEPACLVLAALELGLEGPNPPVPLPQLLLDLADPGVAGLGELGGGRRGFAGPGHGAAQRLHLGLLLVGPACARRRPSGPIRPAILRPRAREPPWLPPREELCVLPALLAQRGHRTLRVAPKALRFLLRPLELYVLPALLAQRGHCALRVAPMTLGFLLRPVELLASSRAPRAARPPHSPPRAEDPRFPPATCGAPRSSRAPRAARPPHSPPRAGGPPPRPAPGRARSPARQPPVRLFDEAPEPFLLFRRGIGAGARVGRRNHGLGGWGAPRRVGLRGAALALRER